MPMLQRDDGEIYFEVHGTGYPVLALAPGWLGSTVNMWPVPTGRRPYPWADWPGILKSRYQVIAMDQRNAGRSRVAIEADHGWHTFAADHLALMDHLGIERFNIVGVCIGASFGLRLCEIAPERVNAVLMPNPIGVHPDFPTNFPDRFVTWAEQKLAERPDLDGAAVRAFGDNMWGGEFVYSVSREFVRKCQTPSLIMPGNNASHPAVIGFELADLLPNATLVTEWECPEFTDQQRAAGLEFFERYTPL